MQTPQDDQNSQTDAEGASVDFDPGEAFNRIDSWIDGFVSLLPNIGIAFILLMGFWFLSAFVKSQLIKRFRDHERPSLGMALGRLAKIAVIIAGCAIALAIIAPSIKLSTLIGSLGVGSVAIGFAFKDILQNWLSGLLILIRQPFKIGDQIEAAGFEGTVESIETRATILKTYNGEHAIIPNAELYTNSVLVKTKTSISRGEYMIGVSYDADIDEVLNLIRSELSKIEEVVDDPAPEAHTWELGDSSVNILARWWTRAEKAEQVRIRGLAVRGVKIALDKAGIDIPFPHLVSVRPGGDETAQLDARDTADDVKSPT
ncbi:mechanosensitive ion channel family protein [Algimonas porphyrae]|uniref:Small-conductance mechanosensitive channel n=1 Tax=Algimonas porphyrae TaxID=1128113 RepID=A0ABQ5V279_9PROT|nr:mechanosensitive ion channel family protein [Algimonas porphyrae]GLQ21160.1 transporter [Algimonas porphyrae]